MIRVSARNIAASTQEWLLAGILIVSSLLASPVIAADDSCVINISQPLIDYGRTTRAELLKGSFQPRQVLLGRRTLTITSVCDAKVERTITFHGEAVDDSVFRFGQNGTFSLKVMSAQLDGRSVRLESSASEGGSASRLGLRFRPGVSLTPYDGLKVATGERLTVQLEVETYIDAETTHARSEDTWKGGGSFEIKSLN